ncbi:hypothetical protein Zmor_025435 [Zophobas morio]|uniref:Uncharacterized protein n=1 Tax=Zophobas morio TaxID=2755281 RepID=A0AA38HWY8_9CUCU|nr:hypothetical protein Zmor_025435 [Zophobas morio]
MNSFKNHHQKKHHSPAGYYWRDYTGEIPDDALPGGHDINKKATFIGQAFLSNVGIVPGTIYPGQPGMRLPFGWNANFSDAGMKILCSSNWNCFSWENANSTNLHMTTIGKQLVIGGCENGGSIVNLGRVMHQGELIVGKVLGYQAGNAKMFYVCGDKEHGVTSYQVLVYYPSK